MQQHPRPMRSRGTPIHSSGRPSSYSETGSEPMPEGHRSCDVLDDCFEALSLTARVPDSGRQRPFAASGSSRWPNIVPDSLTRLRALPPSNVKFGGTADSRPRDWPTSGMGARRHSPAKSERQQPVCSCQRSALSMSCAAVPVMLLNAAIAPKSTPFSSAEVSRASTGPSVADAAMLERDLSRVDAAAMNDTVASDADA